ncbi:DDB1- and CUL4-associated factor homolog 1-like isoform X1 [Punica granatum]|uniref:DDB1- and CUL4-associated factor homolog 1-like isoform X1 n=1 Tax=Punica granatum TaxID=22663 RepID=A0A6P8BST6_PUNGR|nr:DDB1- and CUL4-associated factor homolog 1-like isoform X1 [Punica granatum]
MQSSSHFQKKLGITSPTKPSPRISSLVKFTASVLSAFLLPSSVSPIPPNFRFFLLGGIGNRQFSAVGAAAAASMEEPTRQSQAPDEAAEGGSSSGGGGATTEPPQVPQADEEELLVAKAQSLLDRITAAPDNPSPTALHALASLLESQESRYMEQHDHTTTNARSSYTIGWLCNFVRDNDEFFELVSSKYLSESRFSTSVQAAAARVLLSCSLTWMYPHVFEEPVLENIKSWVMDEVTRFSGEESNWKLESGRKEVSDHQMLKTYSTGLLAVALDGDGPLVEDVLTCGLSSKLMRYLRIRVLGDSSQKDTSHLVDSKNATSRGRDENRGRIRQLVTQPHIGDLTDGRYVEDVERPVGGDTQVDVGEPPDGLSDADGMEEGADGDDRWHGRELGRDDSSRCRANRGFGKSRGKGRASDGTLESEQSLTSPDSGSRPGIGRSNKDRSSSRHTDVKRISDSRKLSNLVNTDDLDLERDDNTEYIEEFKVGTKDISELVREAVRAAEAEARAVNAPPEAIKAATAAAAEVVKSAAMEEFKTSNDEDAAVLAASKAASTGIDATKAVELSRSSVALASETINPSAPEAEKNENVDEYSIPDPESLAQLREKYCIQCLEYLGEYVEVLGPVLHEKGVDVCLALLQQGNKSRETSKVSVLLPDVMKLICALAAHRKFAALFVDCGGMQKLLAVPRVPLTFFGLSSCLFAIGSLQGIMERVCALPSDVVRQVADLAIQLLDCSQNQARKNAALFFAAAFVFRAVLDAFDSQDGLQKLLGVLNDAASVRSGVNSGALGLSGPGSLRNDRLPAEVLTSSEKQIAYHTCVALRQYFRAHLILIVDSIRPTKSNRSAPRNVSSSRAAYNPLDISNEAVDAVFLQLQKDRKLGPAFVRTPWPAVDKFLAYNGHLTMLELCQAPPVERYFHDLLQYALGVLHIITLVPQSRKMIVNATLSNDRVGIAVILDAANITSSKFDPEIIQPALSVLINLVCPPPSISNKPPMIAQGHQAGSSQASLVSNTSDRTVALTGQSDVRDCTGEPSGPDRGSAAAASQTPVPSAAFGLVGDRRISSGAGAGSAGLAAQLEQGYRLARDAVRANNGIKVLLHLLQPRIYSPPSALDCLRALACRALLGLARDDTIAHILTKLQVGKKLSELIRDSGSQTNGGEQGRWQTELAQVGIELIAIVTNSGRASTLAATDAATPTLRRIERAAIAAATPITYHSRELLLLIHEHLQTSGLTNTAASLLKEAQLTPLPTLAAPQSLSQQTFAQQSSSIQIQWPSGRSPSGFLSEKFKLSLSSEDPGLRCESAAPPPKKKSLVFSPSFSRSRNQPQILDSQPPTSRNAPSSSTKQSSTPLSSCNAPSEPTAKPALDLDSQYKSPIVLPMKQKHLEIKDLPSAKRLQGSEHPRSPMGLTPHTACRTGILTDPSGLSTPSSSIRGIYRRSTPGSILDYSFDDPHMSQTSDPQASNTERLTLDSLVIHYLKHQHRLCPAPITTLPPLSLLHPHVCPEPKRSLETPLNVTARLATREYRSMYGGVHGNCRDRQSIFSRFRPWRTCRDDAGALLTCIAFLGDSSHIAVGSHSGELKIFDSNNSIVDSYTSHQSPVNLVQSYISGGTQLLLSSSSQDVRLWDASSMQTGPLHPFEGCKSAKFSNSGTHFAALSAEPSRREIVLYDVQTYQTELKLSDPSTGPTGRGHVYSLIHFSPSDAMVLWNGVLWDRRVSGPVHRLDQFTDYGGGGFHPAGNEVIINSEVWDLRKFRLLRSVPSLDRTAITFNARGDVIYAILRRNLEDVMSAVHTRRVKHPLFAAFRTIDAVNYSDIATIPVDRCVLDFATELTDSFVGLMTMDDQEEMYSSARVYEVGRRRPTDDDSDPDDAEESEDDGDEDDEDRDVDPILGPGLGGDSDSDPDSLMNGDDDDDSVTDLDDDDDDGDFRAKSQIGNSSQGEKGSRIIEGSRHILLDFLQWLWRGVVRCWKMC